MDPGLAVQPFHCSRPKKYTSHGSNSTASLMCAVSEFIGRPDHYTSPTKSMPTRISLKNEVLPNSDQASQKYTDREEGMSTDGKKFMPVQSSGNIFLVLFTPGFKVKRHNLKPKFGYRDCHNLEVYLHLIDGFHGEVFGFRRGGRDIALVDKKTGMLIEKLGVPEYWYQGPINGLVFNSNYGRWVKPCEVTNGEEVFSSI